MVIGPWKNILLEDNTAPSESTPTGVFVLAVLWFDKIDLKIANAKTNTNSMTKANIGRIIRLFFTSTILP